MRIYSGRHIKKVAFHMLDKGRGRGPHSTRPPTKSDEVIQRTLLKGPNRKHRVHGVHEVQGTQCQMENPRDIKMQVVHALVQMECSAIALALGWEIADASAKFPKWLTRARVAACFYIGIKFEDVQYCTMHGLLRRVGLKGQGLKQQLRVEREVLIDLNFRIPHHTRAKQIIELLHEHVTKHVLEQWLVLALVSGTYGVCDPMEWTVMLHAAFVARTRVAPLLQIAAHCMWPNANGDRFSRRMEARCWLNPPRLTSDVASRAPTREKRGRELSSFFETATCTFLGEAQI